MSSRFDVERIYIRSFLYISIDEKRRDRRRRKKNKNGVQYARVKEKEKKNARSTRATVTHDFLSPKTDDGRAEKGELVLAYIFVFHPAGSK